MARAFYRYTITILKKVSFDPELFKKELEKAYVSLLPHERNELRIWLREFLNQKPILKKHLMSSTNFSGQDLVIL